MEPTIGFLVQAQNSPPVPAMGLPFRSNVPVIRHSRAAVVLTSCRRSGCPKVSVGEPVEE